MSVMANDPRDVQHLDEMVLLLYIERQLDRVKAAEVSAHTQECNECRTLLRAMERESRLLTRAMLEEDEVLPARLMQFQQRARRSMQWIWGVLFGLAATGVYALYTATSSRGKQQLQQAGFGSTSLLNLLIFQGVFWKGWQSVITLVEVVAMLTVGGFSFGVLPQTVTARIHRVGFGAHRILRGRRADDAGYGFGARYTQVR